MRMHVFACTQVILLEHDIPHEAFSGKVLACLPPVDWQITPENSVGRRDLRHLPVLSIDPPGCKDIDDALHSRPLENGNLEVGSNVTATSACLPLRVPLRAAVHVGAAEPQAAAVCDLRAHS